MASKKKNTTRAEADGATGPRKRSKTKAAAASAHKPVEPKAKNEREEESAAEERESDQNDENVEVVGTARNGAEAVQQVSQLRPALVLMDIVMPDVDGLSALRLIQAKSPETRVAMLSSVGAMASKAEEAFRLGAIQVLSKPIDEDILGALLGQEIERARSADGSR